MKRNETSYIIKTIVCFLSSCLFILIGSSFLSYGETTDDEEKIASGQLQFPGPRPSDVLFKIEPLRDEYSMNEPVKVKVIFEVVGERKYYYFWDKVEGIGFHQKFFMFDELGIPLPKTASVLSKQGVLFTFGLSPWRTGPPIDGMMWNKRISEQLLNEYVIINRPGDFRLVCFRNWTFWEEDFSVSDITPIRVISTNDLPDVESGDHDAIREEDIWGTNYQGVEISVCPREKPYVFGEDIMLDVMARNTGTNVIELMATGKTFRDFRALLFDEEGKYLFPKKWQSDLPPTPMPGIRKHVTPQRKLERTLGPGEETRYSIRLGEWYGIEKPGTYYLLMARRVNLWDHGFPVSNLARIEVVEPDQKE